jgi:membrane-bound lytic murein transglycosylase MltF
MSSPQLTRAVSNFRAFLHSLKDAGVDMSHVSISRSYAVLVGLEAYLKNRKRGRELVHKLMRGRDELLAPGEAAQREEEERERTEEVERERRISELKMKAEREDTPDRVGATLLERLHIGSRVHGHDKVGQVG